MLNDSKIGQLNSERPLHQTAVMCASVIIVTALAQVFIMWRLKFFIAEVWGFGELPKSNKEASVCHKLSCLLTFHVENLADS